MLYFETVGSLMHDISPNSAPQNICDLFTCSSDIHSYSNRFSDVGDLYVNKSRLSIQLNLHLKLHVNYGIAQSLTCTNSGKNLSKTKFTNFYFTVLGDEDDYVDVSTPICIKNSFSSYQYPPYQQFQPFPLPPSLSPFQY